MTNPIVIMLLLITLLVGCQQYRIIPTLIGNTTIMNYINNITDINLTGYNITADYFIGNGSTLTGGVWIKSGSNVYLSTLNNTVGIGTTTPNAQLEIKGIGGTKTFLRINDTTASGDILLNLYAGAVGSGTYLIYAQNQSSGIFAVRGDGFVGIGTTSLSQKLEVVGRVNAHGYYVNGTELTGGTSTGGFNNDTDIRVNRLVLNTTATITKYGNDTFGYWQNTSCIIIGNFEDKSLC